MLHPLHDVIQTHFQNNLSTYLDLLRQMVEINSFTLNVEGINALGEFTAAAFAGLGFKADTVQSVNPDFGKHLVLTKPGTSGRTIGLISHLDTVFPREEEIRNDFAWREDGHRIYGPGTVDIKGGTVLIYMILEALKRYAPEVYEAMTWVVLLDASEERGGFDFGRLCVERLGAEALAALVFETGPASSNDFQIVRARKGMVVYRLTAYGRAAHAGNSHAGGANAIVQLADAIQQIAAMTDHERNITYNIGSVSGGVSNNRVPHQAEARGEMRAFDREVYDKGLARLLALDGQSTVQSVGDGYACRLKVEIDHKVPPWPVNPDTDRLLRIWQETGQTLGLNVLPQERGGLSDGNQFWQEIPTLDGLGPAGDNLHCSEQSEDGSKEQEYVDAANFVPKALLNTLAILRLIESA